MMIHSLINHKHTTLLALHRVGVLRAIMRDALLHAMMMCVVIIVPINPIASDDDATRAKTNEGSDGDQ